jgi:hypothetical protein
MGGLRTRKMTLSPVKKCVAGGSEIFFRDGDAGNHGEAVFDEAMYLIFGIKLAGD